MKILSYNIYGVKDTKYPIPKWEVRQENINRILNDILQDREIKVCCFQEVNQNNIDLLNKILKNNDFKMLEKFPMKTETYNQHNILAIRNELGLNLNYVYCLPHGKDTEYKNVENQVIDYNMSDYRTTVFVNLEFNNKKYLIGNIHTDYMVSIICDYKLIIGDMNLVCHMSEVYNILKQNNNYITISRNSKFNILDNSWHGYGTKEQVNVDFAFVEKNKIKNYEYQIIKQEDMNSEGSDHRPIIITIN